MTTESSPSDAAPHRRRVRYRGTHPRRFEEKYKELASDLHPDELEKVMARGQTPAGTHRPICVAEILDVLQLRPGMIGLDATLGYGGHARRMLDGIRPGGVLFATDVDSIELPRTEERLRRAGYGEGELRIRHLNFAGARKLLPEAGGGFDFILADLGVSSMQIDNPQRGFSFKSPGPLDLRLNPERGIPASAYLSKLTEAALTRILTVNADEPHAAAIAKVVAAGRDGITTTLEFADAIRAGLQPLHLPQEEIARSLQRCFQALRIAVNEEFSALDQFLQSLPFLLKPNGRAAILAFHSGEDRRVKHAFADGLEMGVYRAVSDGPIRPSGRERFENPRSKCAMLRWAERAETPFPE